jgi:chromosome segregation ATPase
VESNGINSQIEIGKLKGELTAAQQGTEAATKPLRQQLATTEAELHKAQADMVDILQLTKGFQDDIADKTRQITELEPLKEQLTATSNEKKLLGEQLEKRNDDIKSLNDQLTQSTNDHNHNHKQLTQTIAELQTKLTATNNERLVITMILSYHILPYSFILTYQMIA